MLQKKKKISGKLILLSGMLLIQMANCSSPGKLNIEIASTSYIPSRCISLPNKKLEDELHPALYSVLKGTYQTTDVIRIKGMIVNSGNDEVIINGWLPPTGGAYCFALDISELEINVPARHYSGILLSKLNIPPHSSVPFECEFGIHQKKPGKYKGRLYLHHHIDTYVDAVFIMP